MERSIIDFKRKVVIPANCEKLPCPRCRERKTTTFISKVYFFKILKLAISRKDAEINSA
jgi:hypothetical protein